MIEHLDGDPLLVIAPNFSSWDKDDSVIIVALELHISRSNLRLPQLQLFHETRHVYLL
jgi:hypothetical protein